MVLEMKNKLLSHYKMQMQQVVSEATAAIRFLTYKFPVPY